MFLRRSIVFPLTRYSCNDVYVPHDHVPLYVVWVNKLNLKQSVFKQAKYVHDTFLACFNVWWIMYKHPLIKTQS